MSEQEIKQSLGLILSSNEFKDSKRYQELLKYLIEESIKGNAVKETTIAHDIFGKDAKFDPSEDPSIRVYVSNLRKKLEHYYLTTKDKFNCKFDIPKGQYVVHFDLPKQEVKTKSAQKTFPWYYAVIAILTAVIIYLLYSNISSPKDYSNNVNPIWNDFMKQNDKPTMVVFGDYLFLFQKNQSESGGLFVRDPRINTEEDFRDVLKQNPDFIKQFVILNFTFLRPSATWALSEILPILWNSPNKIYLKLSSQVKWEDFQSHNVVFIGSFKTLYRMKQLLTSFNVKYNASPPSLEILNQSDGTTKKFTLSGLSGGNYQKDYGVIVKQRGPKGNVMLFLLGFDEVGIIESAKTSVDSELKTTIENFTKTQLSEFPASFEMIIEAEGVDQTSFKSSVKYFEKFSATSQNK